MRIAYVCRDLASSELTGAGARAFSTACAMAAADHDVHLLSESLAAPRARALAAGHGPQWTRVRDTRPQHRYFTERHAYADRVYDTLQKLSLNADFDVVEFSAADAEALTAVRAKRLLGEFTHTSLLVRLDSERDGAGARRLTSAVSLEDSVDDFARRYVFEHADALLADTPSIDEHRVLVAPFVTVPLGTPALRIPDVGASRTVWHLGALTPHSGLDTFLEAAEIVLATEPGARFVIAGNDTASDPFGRSYWEFCTHRLSTAVRAAVTFVGPLIDARAVLPRAGNQCVIATASADAASSTLLAIARGCVVTVRDRSAAAAFSEPGTSAAVVRSGDTTGLAAALLAVISEPARATSLAHTALRRTTAHYQPEHVAAGLEEVYRSAPGRRDRSTASPASQPSRSHDLVSIVIPLYNQGTFVLGAIESVQASTYPHIEIVVVDDGSTDQATIDVFDSLRNVTKVRQRNCGLSAARNAGIAAASGHYIVPLDADDMIPSDFITPAVDALRHNADLAYVAGYLRYFGLLDHTHVPAGYIPHLSLVVNTHARATALFRRDALTAIGGYDIALPAFEDWDLHVRLAIAGFASDILPLEGHLYRRHASSMTFSSSNAIRLELLQHLMAKHLGHIGHEQLSDLLLLMAQLWKTSYEPSASVKLQQESQQLLVLPDREIVMTDRQVEAP